MTQRPTSPPSHTSNTRTNPRLQRRKRLGEILVDLELVSRDDVKLALEEQRVHPGRRLGRVLVEMGLLSEGSLVQALASAFHMPSVDLDAVATDAGPLPEISPEVMQRFAFLPIARDAHGVTVAIADPLNPDLNDVLRFHLPGMPVRQVLAMPAQLERRIAEFTAKQRDAAPDRMDAILKQLSVESPDDDAEQDVARVTDSDNAVIKFANQMVFDAWRRNASDIHVEPQASGQDLVVRLRVDGECVEYKSIPYAYRSALVSRLKIMANLDIAEHRKPQDGKIRFHFEDKVLELRVATIPTTSGCEDVVMRLLPPAGAMPFTKLELTESNAKRMRQLMSHSYGLILCVGPTGSGKTTTLHAVLRELNTPDMKIWTAEDPVEITQAGLRQVQVAPKIGLDFATALRAFLRADPDIIMVGEMRDRETANIAIEASLTGHLVLSTLHTNTAPETITRLLELGIDAFGFADSLLGVLAQRLARRLCATCRRRRPASGAERAWLDEATAGWAHAASGAMGSDLELWDAVGCERCAGSGYSGRIALHELLVTDDGIRDAVLKHEAITEIRRRAQAGGMTTLLQDGVGKAIAGRTDLRQVKAVCAQ